jgi:ABC-2 type transport system permease protein
MPLELIRLHLLVRRRTLAAQALGLVLLTAMYAALWPSIRSSPSVADVLAAMPEVVRSLLADADMSTAVGYVQAELLALTGPLLLIGFAVATGAAGVAGREDRGTLDLLLANPVTRTRVVLEELGAMLLSVLLLVTTLGVALVAFGEWAGLDLPVSRVVAAMVHLALLAAVFGTLAAAVGAATGQLTAARAVPAVAAVLAWVVEGLAPVVTALQPLQVLSPFHQYAGHLRDGFSGADAAVAATTVVVLAAIGVAGFRRRDVGG